MDTYKKNSVAETKLQTINKRFIMNRGGSRGHMSSPVEVLNRQLWASQSGRVLKRYQLLYNRNISVSGGSTPAKTDLHAQIFLTSIFNYKCFGLVVWRLFFLIYLFIYFDFQFSISRSITLQMV